MSYQPAASWLLSTIDQPSGPAVSTTHPSPPPPQPPLPPALSGALAHLHLPTLPPPSPPCPNYTTPACRCPICPGKSLPKLAIEHLPTQSIHFPSPPSSVPTPPPSPYRNVDAAAKRANAQSRKLETQLDKSIVDHERSLQGLKRLR